MRVCADGRGGPKTAGANSVREGDADAASEWLARVMSSAGFRQSSCKRPRRRMRNEEVEVCRDAKRHIRDSHRARLCL
jgi:hypothetical protein